MQHEQAKREQKTAIHRQAEQEQERAGFIYGSRRKRKNTGEDNPRPGCGKKDSHQSGVNPFYRYRTN